ncbi:MAG: hypothetical protein DSY80_07095 [Desulfocapsa sp.]|nr:MAG: hypothetical protein DSY80_07095 [Desulfocapsa sp.]
MDAEWRNRVVAIENDVNYSKITFLSCSFRWYKIPFAVAAALDLSRKTLAIHMENSYKNWFLNCGLNILKFFMIFISG